MKQDYRQHAASRLLWPAAARAMSSTRLLQVIWAWL